MELTYSANALDEIPAFHEHSVESNQRPLSGSPVPAVLARSGTESHKPLCGASASESAVDYEHASDEQLLEAARSADERAFVELSSRCAASIERRVFNILRNWADAEDAIQDALFRAYTSLGRFRGTCKFSTWLTRIAINSALMQLRRRKSHPENLSCQPGDADHTSQVFDFADPSPNAEEVYAKRQSIERISFEIQRLPPTYRTIVNQYHEQERSLKEAADCLGITVAAAKSRLLRARLAIRTSLQSKQISMADVCF